MCSSPGPFKIVHFCNGSKLRPERKFCATLNAVCLSHQADRHKQSLQVTGQVGRMRVELLKTSPHAKPTRYRCSVFKCVPACRRDDSYSKERIVPPLFWSRHSASALFYPACFALTPRPVRILSPYIVGAGQAAPTKVQQQQRVSRIRVQGS